MYNEYAVCSTQSSIHAIATPHSLSWEAMGSGAQSGVSATLANMKILDPKPEGAGGHVRGAAQPDSASATAGTRPIDPSDKACTVA